MVIPPYAAELRVYQPVVAFPEPERRRWEAYLASGGALSPRDGQRWERMLGLTSACRRSPRLPELAEADEHAYVLTVGGVTLLCPLHTELRMWRAAADLASVLPPELVDAVMPPSEVERASRQHERWLAVNPESTPHILSNRWAVPVRWFVLFAASERRLDLAPPAEQTPGAGSAAGSSAAQPTTAVGRSLVYRTPMAQARRRLARALVVLRRAFDDGQVVMVVESLGRWLEEFHPRSVVELDYGGLVDLRNDADLRADDSAADVAEALARLAQGDQAAAGRAYDRLIERWRMTHRVESAN
jgi:hypothetical protein